jgi:hypothetical protein
MTVEEAEALELVDIHFPDVDFEEVTLFEDEPEEKMAP